MADSALKRYTFVFQYIRIENFIGKQLIFLLKTLIVGTRLHVTTDSLSTHNQLMFWIKL